MVIPAARRILYKKNIFSVISVCSIVKTAEVGLVSTTLIQLVLSFFRVFVIFFLHYENPAEYPAINGGDECRAGERRI